MADPLASPEDPFLTVPEVAAQLRYTEVTIRNWIRNGKLRAIRASNRGYRIRRSDLEAMINNVDITAEIDTRAGQLVGPHPPSER